MQNTDKHKNWILVLSIAIPVVVAALFRVKIKGYDLTFLPPIYATLNGMTAILLVAAVAAIKNKKRYLHEALVKTCITLSALFLVMYVAYHITSESAIYGGTGFIRYVYYFILVTHIVLSIAIVPMVLFTFSRALSRDFERHRALAKFTFPLWLYVAVTGVVVYIMISPYY